MAPEDKLPKPEPTAPAHLERQETLEIKASRHFSGPIPSPEVLARYNEIIPNGAERIMAMAERQSAHRESLEHQVVAGNLMAQRRGAMYGFVLSFTAIAGGIGLIYLGKDASGLTTIICSLASLVAVFLYSKSKQQKGLETKTADSKDRKRR